MCLVPVYCCLRISVGGLLGAGVVPVMKSLFTEISYVEITQTDTLWDEVDEGRKAHLFCVRVRVVHSCR